MYVLMVINSDFSTITCGVPQGSIIRPTLFILYINDLCKASSHLKSILFADDASFYIEGTELSKMCREVLIELNKMST